VETLIDKIRFITFAQQHRLPIPSTFVLRVRPDAVEAADRLSYPCVLKPPMKTPRWEHHTRQKAFKVQSKNELLALYDRCSDWSDALVVQNWVHGDETQQITCNLYFDATSRPLVTWVSRKIRQWPPGTGNGCLSERCCNDEAVNQSIRLFQAAGYRGLGYVEFKHDIRSGELYIIEPNIGRPTGRSAAAEAGGVELLYTMYCDASGRALPAPRQRRLVDAKWIYFRRDLQAAYHAWRCGQLSLAHWLKSWRGKKAYAVFDARDLRPFVGEFGYLLRKLFRRRRRT
jgi:predicted ATP-grasp superfamily ATP-dependent carboligase